MYSRRDWINATQFETLGFKEIRSDFLRRIQESSNQKKPPVFVFDLDSTLFQVSPRTHQILLEWFEDKPERKTQRTRIFENLNRGHIRYSLDELWEDRGLDPDDPLLASAKSFWRKRFFSHEYLKYDEPMPGAQEFVRELFRNGATVVYLTGRDTPQMGFGTLDQLKHHGFPVGLERTRLIMKPRRHHDDVQFKSSVCQGVSEWGRILGQFENEPKNFVAIQDVLGESTTHVFLDTVSSPHPAKAAKGVFRLKHFSDEDLE